MKTLKVLTILGIAATALALNLKASDALLSPHAKESQAKTVAATNYSPIATSQNQNPAGTPRMRDNSSRVPATSKDSGTFAGACAIGSPRQLAQAGKISAATCCKMPATCSTPKSCCAVAAK